MRLEYILDNPTQKLLYQKELTEARRKEIIKRMLWDMHEDVEQGRLLKLLAQAVKYQANEGIIKPNIRLSLFEGRQHEPKLEQETVIKSIEKVVKYSADSKVECLSLSWSE